MAARSTDDGGAGRGESPEPQGRKVGDEVNEIRELYDGLLAAWNSRDAEGFAAFFGMDGVSIGFDGSTASGIEIRDHLCEVFADHSTASYVAKVREVRRLGPDAVLLRAIVGMIPPGENRMKPDLNALQTVVAVRDGDSWRVALLQNTPAQYHGRPELVEQHAAELQDLCGRDGGSRYPSTASASSSFDIFDRPGMSCSLPSRTAPRALCRRSTRRSRPTTRSRRRIASPSAPAPRRSPSR